MDWSGCDLVEVIPGKVLGAPLLKGTRLPVDAIISNYQTGSPIEEIAENYPSATIEVIRTLIDYAAERSAWDDKTLVDWKGCALVEQVPGRCSGAPTIIGTRIFPDTIVRYHWSGSSVDEILEDYPSLTRETVDALVDWMKSHEASAA